MPLARMAIYGKGVQIYLAPTADSRENWQATLKHIACEGRCFGELDLNIQADLLLTILLKIIAILLLSYQFLYEEEKHSISVIQV